MLFAPIALMASMALSAGAAAIPAKRGLITDTLHKLDVIVGHNSRVKAPDCNAWIGNDGDYVSEFENVSGEEVTVVVWGPVASWVNVNKPLITYDLTNGSSVNITFASGISGGWAAIYNDTQTQNGQIFDTWGEFTFDGQFSTFDVSREVNMKGHNMTISSSECTSDMDTCVFKCTEGETCMTGYELHNCENGSQKGAMKGEYAGAASGGCLVGDDKYVKTTFA